MRLRHKLVFVTVLSGCGSIVYKDPSEHHPVTPPSSDTESATQVSPTSTQTAQAQELEFKGYISSAFQLTVDGKQYNDSEAFYTQEMSTLQSEADQAGYSGWQMTFDAQIGLDDLKSGMHVYVVADDPTGYGADTTVGGDGNFSVTFPSDGTGNYKVRANKRVNVTLKDPKGGNTVVWCYNFSAIDQNVKLADHDKPVILNAFTTEVTKYQCSSSSNSGISIPANPAASATATATSTGTSSSTSTSTGS